MAAILPEDSGVIRCICGYSHDDNFTIQCERCNAWQHAKCVDISDESAVPENYLCPDCSGTIGRTNRDRARAIQRQVLQEKQELARRSKAKLSDEHEEEDRKKRGRRKLEAKTVGFEKPPPPESFEPQFCNIPTNENLWTDAAARIWRTRVESSKSSEDGGSAAGKPAIRPVSNRDLKSPAPIEVVRHQCDKKWRFGVNDAAVVVQANLGAHRFVCEVVGEVMARKEYVDDRRNQFARLGCPKRGVVFVPGLPLVVDSRSRGSQALFIRRSSHPNTRVATRQDAQGNFRLVVMTTRAVKSGEELTLGWYWPASHPLRLGGKENAAIMRTIFWLLDTSEPECRPSDSPAGDKDADPGEDWELDMRMSLEPGSSPRHIAVPRRLRPAEILVEGSENEHDIKLELWSEPRPDQPGPARRRSDGESPAEAETRKGDESGDDDKRVREDDDPKTARPFFIWEAATQNVPPPPKKRMSLADYMRKRA